MNRVSFLCTIAAVLLAGASMADAATIEGEFCTSMMGIFGKVSFDNTNTFRAEITGIFPCTIGGSYTYDKTTGKVVPTVNSVSCGQQVTLTPDCTYNEVTGTFTLVASVSGFTLPLAMTNAQCALIPPPTATPVPMPPTEKTIPIDTYCNSWTQPGLTATAIFTSSAARQFSLTLTMVLGTSRTEDCTIAGGYMLAANGALTALETKNTCNNIAFVPSLKYIAGNNSIVLSVLDSVALQGFTALTPERCAAPIVPPEYPANGTIKPGDYCTSALGLNLKASFGKTRQDPFTVTVSGAANCEVTANYAYTPITGNVDITVIKTTCGQTFELDGLADVKHTPTDGSLHIKIGVFGVAFTFYMTEDKCAITAPPGPPPTGSIPNGMFCGGMAQPPLGSIKVTLTVKDNNKYVFQGAVEMSVLGTQSCEATGSYTLDAAGKVIPSYDKSTCGPLLIIPDIHYSAADNTMKIGIVDDLGQALHLPLQACTAAPTTVIPLPTTTSVPATTTAPPQTTTAAAPTTTVPPVTKPTDVIPTTQSAGTPAPNPATTTAVPQTPAPASPTDAPTTTAAPAQPTVTPTPQTPTPRTPAPTSAPLEDIDVSLVIEGDADAFKKMLDNEPAKLKDAVADDLAKTFNMPRGNVRISSVRVGSLHVNFTLLDVEDEEAVRRKVAEMSTHTMSKPISEVFADTLALYRSAGGPAGSLTVDTATVTQVKPAPKNDGPEAAPESKLGDITMFAAGGAAVLAIVVVVAGVMMLRRRRSSDVPAEGDLHVYEQQLNTV